MLNKRIFGVALGALIAAGVSTGARADDVYIPLVSKGFQHQFWQAVKLGAEQAAKTDNVKITRSRRRSALPLSTRRRQSRS